jgi:hypothetical protein
MRIALCILAERSGLAPTTQAMVLLRQALDRTMQSAQFAAAVKGLGVTVGDWQTQQFLAAAQLAAEKAEKGEGDA